MKISRTTRPTARAESTNVLLIAEHGALCAERFADLERQGARVSLIVERCEEPRTEFRQRVEGALKVLKCAPDQTVFVAREPVGPRLLQIVDTIVSSLPNDTTMMLVAAEPSAHSTRALSALALKVAETAHDVRIAVEGQRTTTQIEPHYLWRRRIDRVLHALRQPPVRMRHAG